MIKRSARNLLEIANKLYLLAKLRRRGILSARLFLTNINADPEAGMVIRDSALSGSKIKISGHGSSISIQAAMITKSNFIVEGCNCSLDIGAGVSMCGTTIVVKGKNCSVRIGRRSYFGGMRLVNTGTDNAICVGEDCMFSDNIEIWSSDTHDILDGDSRIVNPGEPIFIGDKVWIASHAKILKGVVIKDNSVVGMGSIVTNDVPSNTISAGVPNRTIRSDITWRMC
jgi:acetyltransferase-like isoleucine patch superfamily enzyme